ncbi:hypothetical protein HHK36_028054 [Tetracentron sinense]|uniref:Calcium ion-binding protein n=1 Tax=Tetracentron sinense TaxID=13715 RepID=A0A834YJ75_TETSI|nr:hypothetical protein HHK36_028054 [Tetracentron sinense]
MGLVMSSMGLGIPSMQMLSTVTDKLLYQQFIDKEIKDFDDFHMAMLDIFNTFNSAVPGKHYDVPSQADVKVCFDDWKSATEPDKKKRVFMEFMTKNVNTSKLDDSTMIAGVVTPPIAMALKRAGENVPQIRRIKIIPDVIFVPSMTLLALVSVKITRRIVSKKTNHRIIDRQDSANQGPKRDVHVGGAR